MSAHGFHGFFQLQGKWWYGVAESTEKVIVNGREELRIIISARNDKGEYIRMKAPVANWQAATDLYLKVVAAPLNYPQQYSLIESDVMGC